jgi:hypothetical protein
MWPKNEKGEWLDIDPKFDGGMGGRDYYDENNAYTYQWHVQHDIQGLIGLMGGREEFSKTLDQLFREPLGRSKYAFYAKFPDATGNVGQFFDGQRTQLSYSVFIQLFRRTLENTKTHPISARCLVLRIIFSEFPAMRMAAG